MDHLSSSELDSPSKTPLFVGVAALVLGLAGLALGWLGFTKSTDLENKLALLGEANERMAQVEASIEESGARTDQVGSALNNLSQEVRRVLGDVERDISDIKRNVRSVAIEAGTAKKMAEETRNAMEQFASAGPPSAPPSLQSSQAAAIPTAPVSEGGAVPQGKGGVYTIKQGDTLGRVAAAHNVTLAQVLDANPGIDPRRLRIGQQIVIPGVE